MYAKNKDNFSAGLLPRTDKQNDSYKNRDNDPKGPWKATPLHAKSGSVENNYTIEFPNGIFWTPPKGRFPRYAKDTLLELYNEGSLYFNKNGGVDKKTYLSEVKQGITAGSLLKFDEVGHTHENNEELASLLGKGVFDNPKGTKLIKLLSNISNLNVKDLILDFFAGSGTTAHACIKLNREDGGKRKYILVEMGEYFGTVTKPRVLKAIYSDNYKDGRPLDKNGISQFVKYFSLESYEDALEALNITPKPHDLFTNDILEKDYLLKYTIGDAGKNSLSSKAFEAPFSYCLKIHASQSEENKRSLTKVDMVETFNYLLGASVKSMTWPLKNASQKLCMMEASKAGSELLILWREGLDNKALNEALKKLDMKDLDSYDGIYVNSDSNVAMLTSAPVMLIDEVFSALMFEAMS